MLTCLKLIATLLLLSGNAKALQGWKKARVSDSSFGFHTYRRNSFQFSLNYANDKVAGASNIVERGDLDYTTRKEDIPVLGDRSTTDTEMLQVDDENVSVAERTTRQEEKLRNFDEDDDAASCAVEGYETVIQFEQEMIVLDRERTLVESWDVYTLVSILAATCSLDTINSDNSTGIDHLLILSTSTVTALLGIYATVVYSLCVIYGLTALGMKKDAMYSYFVDASKVHRQRAFQATIASYVMFMLELVLVVNEKLSNQNQILMILFSFGAVLFTMKDGKEIMDKGSPAATMNDNGLF